MIKLKNITKYYSGSDNITLGLRKINLELHKCEFIAITGESGSGKSTLLNVISGNDTYNEGELLFNNQPTSHYDTTDWENYRNKKIGFIYQNYNLIDSYTVLDNVIAPLYIQGYEKTIAKKIAKEIIDKVELTDCTHNKATQLSSGQKQRLSIARALAKNTEVIIADEPTGNLDSETSKKIIELLYKISKEKLVIVVTHNYEEVKDLATRKISMCDGEIQSDCIIKKTCTSNIDTEKKQTVKQEKNICNFKNIATKFAFMNFSSQPKKVSLLLFFFLIISLSSYMFLGQILAKYDDTLTKSMNHSHFSNNDLRRICVSKKDKSDFVKEDIDNIKDSIKKVICVDKYDFANEVIYAYNYGIDYNIIYKKNENADNLDSNPDPTKTLVFLDETKNVKSCNFFNKDTLSYGTMPTKTNEIIICSNDKSLLGKEINFCFKCNKKWSYDTYFSKKMIVSGLVNNKTYASTNEVFFSEKFEQMLCSSILNPRVYLKYYIPQNGFARTYCEEIVQPYTCIINNNLEDKCLTYSETLDKKIKGNLSDPNLSRPTISKDSTYSNPYSKYTSHGNKHSLDYTSVQSENLNSKYIIEINEKMFNKFYNPIHNQVSIYVEDYAYVKDAITQLYKKGYNAISPVKVSSTTYNNTKVNYKFSTIIINLILLLSIFLLEIIIIKTLLKYKKNDFIILKLLGMKAKTTNLINYYEIFSYKLFCIILGYVIVCIFYSINFTPVTNVFKYYSFLTIILHITLNILATFIMIFSYNNYLKKQFSITSLNNI